MVQVHGDVSKTGSWHLTRRLHNQDCQHLGQVLSAGAIWAKFGAYLRRPQLFCNVGGALRMIKGISRRTSNKTADA